MSQGQVGLVQVNVTQQVAPTPNNLQKTGAFISVGATSKAANSLTLLTQLSDLTAILNGALANSTLTWAANVATVTTAAPHGIPTSDTVMVTIAGVTPSTYNGTYLATSTGASTFTYPLTTDPGGSASVHGTWTLEDVAELLAMGTTFFAQGTNVPVYVLELGTLDTVDAIAALSTWLTNNPETIYSFLVPREWDAVAQFLTLMQSFESTTSKTYFWVTTTTGTYSSYTVLMKCVNALIEAPTVTPTGLEFSQAAPFWVSLHYDPSSSNKVAPFAYTFVVGVTPYPTPGNKTLFTQLRTANISIIGTGAEGGISNTILLWGNMLDGRPFNYWYAVDWVQINIVLNITNAVINGSNDPLNPLYLDPAGIKALEGVAAGTMQAGVTVGLVFGTVIQTQLNGANYASALANGTFAGKAAVNAIPFVDYYQTNPGDFKIGKYAGFSIVFTPNRGFALIVFNIVVTDFVAGSISITA